MPEVAFDTELVVLIIDTKSMDTQEKWYWFRISHEMTPAHKERLREILLNEKRELEAIDKEYNEKIAQLSIPSHS